MKRAIIEFVWLIGILIITTMIYFLAVSNSVADINMHDTYIIGNGQISHPSPTTYFLSVFIVVSFLIYLARVSYNGFKEITANLILMFSTGMAVFYFSTNIIFYFTVPQNTGVYFGYGWDILLAYYIIKIFLIVVLGFTAFITGKNMKPEL